VINKTFGATTVSALALCATMCVGAVPAWAADEPAPEEIVVSGLRASLRDAIQAKRASSVVTETISSKDIGVLPDVTIADELARLPGVTATRSRQCQPGLGAWPWPRLVLGLINGREVASSEPDRNVAGKSTLPRSSRASPSTSRRART
jgi:hypothetical protein